MNLETAHCVSRDLGAVNVPHTIAVGHHPQAPSEGETEFPEIHARIDVPMPRRHALPMGDYVGRIDEALSATIARIEAVADSHGLDVETGIMQDGLTLSSRSLRPVR